MGFSPVHFSHPFKKPLKSTVWPVHVGFSLLVPRGFPSSDRFLSALICTFPHSARRMGCERGFGAACLDMHRLPRASGDSSRRNGPLAGCDASWGGGLEGAAADIGRAISARLACMGRPSAVCVHDSVVVQTAEGPIPTRPTNERFERFDTRDTRTGLTRVPSPRPCLATTAWQPY